MENMKSAILRTVLKVFVTLRRETKNWCDENDKEIQDLLEEKRAAHQGLLAQPTCSVMEATFRHACITLRRKLGEILSEWLNHLASKSQLCANIGNNKDVYEELRVVDRPTHQVITPLHSSDGRDLRTDNVSTNARLSEHF